MHSYILNLLILFQAKKSHRNSNPIYNMLPDILSHLSHERDLPSAEAEAVMMVTRLAPSHT
jgi:hypothetical protein